MTLSKSENARALKIFVDALRGGTNSDLIKQDLYGAASNAVRNLRILPKRKKEKPMIIESIGQPRQGKTTFLNEIRDGEVLGGKNIFTAEEFEYAEYQYAEVKNEIVEDVLREEVFWWSMMNIQNFYASKEKAENANNDMLWVERGGNDSIAMIQAILATNPLEFVNEELQNSKRTLDEITEIMKMLIGLSPVPHAVILFLGTANKAMERRKKDELGTIGRLINPEMWKYLNAGYIWWLVEYYSFLQDNFGTGILVVDGRNSSDENSKRIENYIEEII